MDDRAGTTFPEHLILRLFMKNPERADIVWQMIIEGRNQKLKVSWGP
jgi:hypothetical protein